MAKEINFNGTARLGESKIKTDELDMILNVIKENFAAGQQFKNKDLSELIKSLTARQIPSRLKKLVDDGSIVDCGGNPKSYSLPQ